MRIGHGLLALALGAVLLLATNFVVAKQLTWTPGGFALSFGRMLQDGIVKKYLNDHCPDPKLLLCAYKEQLPDDADVWFWGSPLFDKLGRFWTRRRDANNRDQQFIEVSWPAGQDRGDRHGQAVDRRSHRRRGR
ncbi:MAG: hypothetical protein WCC81_10965 [Pseudolabrys sp.]